MDKDFLLTRISEIADAAGLEPERLTPEDQCWVNGRSCPYGLPSGKFVLRPETFCRSDVCDTYTQHVDDGTLDDEEAERVIDELFEHHAMRVSGIVTRIADLLPEESAERLVVQLAADVIAERKDDDTEIVSSEARPQRPTRS